MLSMLFAIALLSSGQSSTITGTLSGQIIMEGFIRLRVPLWVQRLVTRLLSVTPVLIFAIYYHGNEAKIEDLLTISQVFLSIALPFAVIPLVIFTSSKTLMGEFANRTWVKYSAWVITVVLIILNIYLIGQTLMPYIETFLTDIQKNNVAKKRVGTSNDRWGRPFLVKSLQPVEHKNQGWVTW